MNFPPNKIKIVCTIGPASSGPQVLEKMLLSGMDVARLNLAHGDFEGHGAVVSDVRRAARAIGKRAAILADLPGPKMRIGRLREEFIELRSEDAIVLTTEDIEGWKDRVPVSFNGLPEAVRHGDTIYLNDGFIQLRVDRVDGHDVYCRVIVGGALRPHKGINVPGADLGISAVTDYDLKCLAFAAREEVDAVSVSFVQDAGDIKYLREAASKLSYEPFIVAKIERRRALDNIDTILDAADGIMVARGDLGVEIPIEEIAVVQKRLIRKARFLGKPVITATQMLESMVDNRRPTRAEVTDVANAILDGTDCVMLSEESAMGKYPLDAVSIMARIAHVTETELGFHPIRSDLEADASAGGVSVEDIIAAGVHGAVSNLNPVAIVTPTASGATARRIARLRPHVWIVAMSFEEATCQRLVFSCGVYPVLVSEHISSWESYCRRWFSQRGDMSGLIILTQGPSIWHPGGTNRMEIIDLGVKGSG